MKLKYTLVFSIISFFITTAGFSQELSDREMRFDVARTTIMLKEHGIKDQDLAREVTTLRMMQAQQYVEIKKIEDGILQKITDEQIAKMNKSRVSNTAKAAFVDIPQTERDVLIAFYNSTGGANWTNTIGNNKVWDVTNPSSDVSTWFGVSVTNGHVSQINFYSNNLTGTIPPQIGQLTKLVSLDLNNNKLTGSMPVEIGLLSDLVSLQLSSNFLTGGIPVEIGQLLKLNSLGLRNNTLSNEIPSEIGNLSKLQFIYLDNNQLSGKIPFQIGQLPDLKSLYLYFNQLTGNIPSEVGQLNKLETLMLSYNKLIGSIPAQLGQLISLKSLGLNGNQLSGNIPLEFGQLTNIEGIGLGGNQYLSGSIPSQLGQLSKLKALSLYSNQLSGPLPIEICQLLNLTSLSLDQNQLSGGIPIQIGKLVNLTELDLQRNQLTGSIPNEIGQLVNITKLHLNNNQLTGTIPPEMGQLSKIVFLILSDNQLTGSIPSELVNLSSMTNFGINNNLLEGKFPDLTLLRSLSNFSFSNNKFRFIDFADHYATFKSKFTTFFEYAPQAKIDSEETVKANSGVPVTLTMCTDDRFTNNDTFQWYKGVYPQGKIVPGATSRRFLISSPITLDAGDYYCLSKNPQITDPSVNGYYGANRNLILERNPIHLEVINCTPVTGTLKASTESPSVNGNTAFSLETAVTGLTYKWTFYNDASGTTVKDGTQTTATASQSYSVAGSYLVRLEVTEANSCTTKFDKVVNVINNCVDSYSPNRNGSINTPYPYGDISGVVLNKVTNLSFYSSSGSTSLSYQWGLFNSNNLLVASGNQAIFPITVTNAGDYKVTLRVMDATGCSSFERDLKTREATPCIVPISDRDGYIINPTNSEKLLVNTATVLSLNRGSSYTTTGFTYKWDLVKLNGEVVFSGNDENFSVIPTEIGDYKINLQIKDPNGCTTDYTRDYKVVDICVFTEDETGWIGASGEYNGSATYFVKINESKDFNLTFGGQDFSANLTYKWRLLNPSGELISTSTNATFSSVFTIPGYYGVELETTNTITGCKKNYTKEVGCLISNSCTELNPKSAEVKTLLNNLIKSLLIRSIKGETDAQINASPTSPEFLALKPYITNGTGNTIYNFSKKNKNYDYTNVYIEAFDFSFSPDRLSDIHLEIWGGISEYANYGLSDEELSNRLDYDIFIDLSQYISSNDYFTSCRIDTGGKNAESAVRPKQCRQESEVRYIDFCPTDCAPIEGTLTASTVTPIINTSTKFSFGTVATNLTYNWTVTNSANIVVETTSNTTGLYSFIANTIGNYTITLKVVNEKKCETEFSKTITAIAPLPIVDCETHFNFNFKIPASVKGGILNNIEREHIANGIISFVNKNINEKLYLTTYDDHSSGVRTVALQNKYTTVFADATTNTSNETQGGFFRIQDDFYNDTFRNTISYVPSGIINNTGITKKIDVSFFVISEDNFADIAASKAAYADLLNSAKCKKIFFIFLDEGRFRNRTLNTYISPIEFASQLKGSTAVNYSTTSNILTSDFISFSKAQIADESFKNVLSAFLDKSYTQVKSKKCTTASCVTTNPNSQVVKGLFMNLVNKLQSLPTGTVTNGYTCAELIALTPFITIPNPKIFNYNQGSFSFSNLVNNIDVFMGANAQVTDVNLESYVDSETETNFIAKYGTTEKGSSVKHINFCPEKLCTSIEGVFKSTPQVLNANVNANFSLETTAINLTYDWTFYNLDNTTELAKATTAIPTQSFTAAGRYRVVLNVKDDKGCVTPFENFVTVLPACTLITGVIKIGSGVTPTPSPNPTPVPTKSYWYQAVHPLDFRGTDYVVYIDGNGVKQTYTLTRTESGYNAPCTEIIASSIFNHTGATPCVSE